MLETVAFASTACELHRSTISSAQGAGAAVGGFLLVFLGVLISSFQSFSADTYSKVLDRVRTRIWVVLVAFALNLVGVAYSFLLLLYTCPTGTMYKVGIGSFFVQLFLAVGAAVYVTVGTVGED